MGNAGRNDPCPWGSGKKYKRCCLSKDEAAEVEAVNDQRRRRLGETPARFPPEVEEVVVLGSFARGTFAPGSDLDVLIVLTQSAKPFRDRIPDYLPGSFPVGVDVLPYTRAAFRCGGARSMSLACGNRGLGLRGRCSSRGMRRAGERGRRDRDVWSNMARSC
jgi:predicted nucleotidyltransferase